MLEIIKVMINDLDNDSYSVKSSVVVTVYILILLLIWRAMEDCWQVIFYWILDRCR